MKHFGTFLTLLLSLLLAGCQLPGGTRVQNNPLAASLERKFGLIAFIGSDGNVYTINQGGEELRAITTDATTPNDLENIIRYYQAVAWSPDSESLAFVRLEGNPDDPSQNHATLMSMPLDGEEPSVLYDSRDIFPFYLYWTPDGSSISFIANTPSQASNVLQMIPSGGGEPTVLDTGSPYYFAWAPDSANLLIHAGGNGSGQSIPRLSFVTPGEDKVRERLIDETPNIFPAPAWMPDGRSYLHAEFSEGSQFNLVLSSADGSTSEILMQIGFPIAFGLSPDGKKVAVIVREQLDHLPRGPLYVFDLDNPEDKFITEAGNVAAFFWSPDSSLLAYLPYERTQLQAQAGEDGETQTIEVGLLTMGVYDTEENESHDVLSSFLPTEGFLSMLTFFDQYNLSATIWSPDNRNLVLAARNFQGQNLIMMVAASGNLEPRFLAEGVFAVWSWK